jgi:prepilin-type N-terminal cleavage/methylation domain-containing protein
MSGFAMDQNSFRKAVFDHWSRPPAAVSRGYSLLELMIVLVVLVGLLAFAWPSLSKPLANSDLQQAATQLRTLLAEARLSAMQSGEPVLVRIEHGSGVLTYASWHQTMMPVTVKDLETELDGTETEVVAPTGDVESADGKNRGESWGLPEGIVIDAVNHAGPRISDDERPSLLEGELGISSSTVDLSMSGSSIEMDSLNEESSAELRTSWIWFLPQGQSCGASIRLLDIDAQRVLTLQIHSWNGAITLEKPEPIIADDEGAGLEYDELYSREEALNGRKSGSFAAEDSTLDPF